MRITITKDYQDDDALAAMTDEQIIDFILADPLDFTDGAEWKIDRTDTE